MSHVYVWDTLARSVVFSAAQGGCYGTGAWWRGQSAAAGATHVAAIQHLSATVDIWRLDQPAEPVARLTGYSQGARRLWFHGGSLTTHTLQPVNTHLGVMQIDLQGGAAQMLTQATSTTRSARATASAWSSSTRGTANKRPSLTSTPPARRSSRPRSRPTGARWRWRRTTRPGPFWPTGT
ncbi:hypothetical protein [Nannocystis pusilla]|uniref:hypothetical protein n=1 Tax=Nannocystis pusilla TaxID=889268 RepID=UPI003B7B0654